MIKKRRKLAANSWQFNVAQLLKEATGATRHYQIETFITNPTAADVEFSSPVKGDVKFLRTGADILVTGLLETVIQKNCGRCLTPFETTITVELEEQFYPTIDVISGVIVPPPAEADEANRIDEHHILDLAAVVAQGLLLESEGVRYCRPDCKGLCPHCGQDRNTEPCRCEDEKIDSRWADLLALQNDE
jgi:uncharacterized protein